MTEIMYREALNRAIFEEMRRDPMVFTMGVGVAERGGSYKVTEGFLKEFGSERVIDTPIAEASFTGAAVGAALVGARPVVEVLFIDFTTLVMDQLINQAAKYEFMSGGQGKVPMVFRTQGGAGNGLAAQHSQSLEAIYYHRPIVVNVYEVFRRDIQPKGFQVVAFEDFITEDTVRQTRAILADGALAAEMTAANYELGRRYYSYRVLEERLVMLMNRALGP